MNYNEINFPGHLLHLPLTSKLSSLLSPMLSLPVLALDRFTHCLARTYNTIISYAVSLDVKANTSEQMSLKGVRMDE
jgi:hypothetical protein